MFIAAGDMIVSYQKIVSIFPNDGNNQISMDRWIDWQKAMYPTVEYYSALIFFFLLSPLKGSMYTCFNKLWKHYIE